jgi:hypothetical protein
MGSPPGIFFFYPDFAHPVGGMRIAYRHVDLLNKLGHRARMVHRAKGFRCTWFENATPVLAAEDVRVRPEDIVVLPEIVEPRHALAYPGIKLVIFNQGAYCTFQSHGWQKEDRQTPYTSPDLLGVFVVSEDNFEYLAYAFPGLRLLRYRCSINPRLFAPGRTKRNLIAFMPRRGFEDVRQVLNIVKFRGLLDDYELRPVEGLSLEQVAEVLSEVKIFLSSGTHEGCPLPPLEAMACGCLVVGYHGFGGREYFRPEFSFPVEVGNVQQFAHTLERVLLRLKDDPDSVESMARQASQYVLEHYSEEREEESVRHGWETLLAGAAGMSSPGGGTGTRFGRLQ